MMSSQTTSNEAITRSAARLRLAVLLTILAMVALYALARLGMPLGTARVDYRANGADVASTQIIGDITVALLVIALFRLSQMLGHIRAGQLFSAPVVARFRSFAFWLLIMALFELIAPTAAQLLTLSHGGDHRIEISVDFRDILTVAVTLVLFLLARLLERARTLDEENREFV